MLGVTEPEEGKQEEEKGQAISYPPIPQRLISNVDCIIVNYKTYDLTKEAVESFAAHYPVVSLILIDNGSQDDSTLFLRSFAQDHHTTLIVNDSNIGHGPAMHQGILLSDKDFIFTLDSDCIVIEGGFIELMLEVFDSDPFLYATGKLLWTNVNGVSYPNQSSPQVRKVGIPYIHPFASMIRRSKYFQLPPFRHSGAPAIINMRVAFERRVHVQDFPIYDYIQHRGSGTRRKFGGTWNPILELAS